MKTKSRGGFTRTNFTAWLQDYTWNALQMKFVPGSKTSWPSYNLSGELETITWDDTKRTGRSWKTRACTHTKVCVRDRNSSARYFKSAAGTSYREHYTNLAGYTTSPLTRPDLASIHMEALDFFRSGCVERQFDLAADLAEWRQVKSLLPGVLTSIKTFVKAFQKSGLLGPKTAMKSFADLHLTYAFGVKPLVSDIKDFAETLHGLREKITWLRKNQGKPVKVSFSKDLSTSFRPNDVVTSYGLHVFRNKVREYTCFYRAYALLVYDVEGLSDLELKLRILTRSFGLDKPLSTLYELTPWSFVVDWVIKVGDLLENLSPAITLPYHFLDVGYTLKMSEVRGAEEYFPYPYQGQTSDLGWVSRKSSFFREVGLPISFSLLTGNPGRQQLALAISLAIQKW